MIFVCKFSNSIRKTIKKNESDDKRKIKIPRVEENEIRVRINKGKGIKLG